MVVFLVVAAVGLVLLLGGLVADVGDHLEALHALLPDALPETPLTTPAVGAALTALGGGGALGLRSGAGAGVATLLGLGAAVLVGGVATWLTVLLIGAPAVPARSADLLGALGTVVTRVPGRGLGEVVVPLAGAPVKVAARAASEHDPPLAVGTRVHVLAVVSATCVVVAPLPPFLTLLPVQEDL